MAVNTALTTVELAPPQNLDAESNLETIALGYTLTSKMQVDKDRLTDVFLQTLFKNVQAKNITQQEQFKQYVPLLAVVQYDTLWMTAYCEKDIKDDDGNAIEHLSSESIHATVEVNITDVTSGLLENRYAQ